MLGRERLEAIERPDIQHRREIRGQKRHAVSVIARRSRCVDPLGLIERKLGPSSISKAAAISHRRAGLTTVQNLPTREIRSIQDGSGPEGGSLIASLDTESMG